VLFACDWVRAHAGRDPAGPWRGYGSKRAAARIVARAGGMVPLVSGGMARAGIPETSDPLPGDIGLIDREEGLMMAIMTPLGWAVKTPSGIACVEAAPVKAWSV
jgi:hypothetical protein